MMKNPTYSELIKMGASPEEARKILAGKGHVEVHIPTHWGKKTLECWEIIHPTWGKLAAGREYKTKEEAIDDYDRVIKSEQFRPTKGGPISFYVPPKIYPVYRYEGAIQNPIVIGWDEGFIPEKSKRAAFAQLEELLKDKVTEQRAEEGSASSGYEKMAEVAEELSRNLQDARLAVDFHDFAVKLKSISSDEREHHDILNAFLKKFGLGV